MVKDKNDNNRKILEIPDTVHDDILDEYHHLIMEEIYWRFAMLAAFEPSGTDRNFAQWRYTHSIGAKLVNEIRIQTCSDPSRSPGLVKEDKPY